MNKKDANKMAQAYNDMLSEIPQQVLKWIKSTSETLKSAEPKSGEGELAFVDISGEKVEKIEFLQAVRRYSWLKRIPVKIEKRYVYAAIADGLDFIVYSMSTADRKRVKTFLEYLAPRELALEIIQAHSRVIKIVNAFEYELYEKQNRIASHLSGAIAKILARKIAGDFLPKIEVFVYKIATADSVYFNIELCIDPVFESLNDGENL